MKALAPVSARRRRTDQAARVVLALGTVLAVIPLALILYYVVKKGIGAWSVHFFTSDPSGRFFGDAGGIRSAVVGTVEIVALATAVAAPVGIGLALYLNEYGKGSRFATVVRFFVDVLTGVPSIVFGLFIYITLVLTGVLGSFAGWKGAAALALLMLPIVTRSAEVVLALVPDSLREAALALGAPRWKVVLRVVLPTALPGVVTGVLLSIARAAGETLHRHAGQGNDARSLRAHELAPGTDLLGRRPGSGPSGAARLGGGAGPRGDDPLTHDHCTSSRQEEQLKMNVELSELARSRRATPLVQKPDLNPTQNDEPAAVERRGEASCSTSSTPITGRTRRCAASRWSWRRTA